MNNDDRQLIAGLFDRMHAIQDLDKDRDAEAFIHQSMRENGNSPYLLVQSVLAQEVALQEAGRRIDELEAELAAARAGAPGAQRASAGFSGRPSAVPSSQPAPWEAQPAASAASGKSSSTPWGAPVDPGAKPAQSGGWFGRSSSVPTSGRDNSQTRSTSPQAAAPQPTDQARRGGGGFLGQAMTTAAGVAGGMLLANSIGSLFGGASQAQAATPASATPALPDPSSSATSTEPATPAADTSATDQAHLEEASDDSWGGDPGWGGDDDFGGGDFEI